MDQDKSGEQKLMNSFVISNLEVCGLEDTTFIELPKVFTHGSIPVHAGNIPKQSDIQRWPYLQEVSIPEIEADVGLLIGVNCSRAMEPWRIINGQDGGPYAVKTAIGWVVNGPIGKLPVMAMFIRRHFLRLCLAFWGVSGTEPPETVGGTDSEKRLLAYQSVNIQHISASSTRSLTLKLTPVIVPVYTLRFRDVTELQTHARKLNIAAVWEVAQEETGSLVERPEKWHGMAVSYSRKSRSALELFLKRDFSFTPSLPASAVFL
ncbi:hypothetical protein QQF64_000586 [Cirrhinus molitorella]|uniref:Peptidase aspartic putative domain-containing protein n=1 Tax=Cirrhinus molitorella TaxID=172907 RepID=A0ABR3NYJ2_9TELE